MIEWQQYPGRDNENTEYAIVNERKAEITKGEDGGIFVRRYDRMIPANPKGTPWWRGASGSVRFADHQAAQEYAEQWLRAGQEG